jgi:site-specific recombinase XerC
MTSGAQTGAEFVGFLEAWLESLSSAGHSPITVECYRRDLADFKRIACRLSNRGNIDMKLVGQEQLDLIVSAWKAEAASTQTIVRRFSALRGFARCLIATGRMDCSRLLAAKVAGSERTRRPLFSEQEMAARPRSRRRSRLDGPARSRDLLALCRRRACRRRSRRPES